MGTTGADRVEQQGESVEVKRKRLRATVRQYRQKLHLTQKQAADELGWSVSKLLRLEQGSSTITPSDVRAMMHLYRETDVSVVDALVELAKQAREEKGYAAYADIASQAYQELMGLEVSAKVIYKYEPSVIPGLFQTEDYARALSRALGHASATIERQVRLRLLRQRAMLDSSVRPELNFVLGEAALARRVGGSTVMTEQIAHLLELSREEGINLTMLPFDAGPHRRMGSAFTILQFDDEQLNDVLYLEGGGGDTLGQDDLDEIRFYQQLYVEISEMAEAFGSFEEQVEAVRRVRYAAAQASG